MSDSLYLYVIVRDDMDSLNESPGKQGAQISHATSQVHEIFAEMSIRHEVYNALGHNLKDSKGPTSYNIGPTLTTKEVRQSSEFNEWKEGTGSFGATIVLEASIGDIREAVDMFGRAGIVSGITHDPTYPLRDGQTTHLIPLDTCGWAFGRKSQLSAVLGQFPLLKPKVV